MCNEGGMCCTSVDGGAGNGGESWSASCFRDAGAVADAATEVAFEAWVSSEEDPSGRCWLCPSPSCGERCVDPPNSSSPISGLRVKLSARVREDWVRWGGRPLLAEGATEAAEAAEAAAIAAAAAAAELLLLASVLDCHCMVEG